MAFLLQRREPVSRIGSRVVLLGAALGLSLACGGGGGKGSRSVTVGGELRVRPDGVVFFQEAHQGGNRPRFHLKEITWGRVVDVFGLDEDGEVGAEPVMRDLVVVEDAVTNATGIELLRNPVTGRNRLVIHRRLGAPDEGFGTFESLLRATKDFLPAVVPRGPLPTSPVPPSLVPRNACLVLHFDDLLANGPEERRRLAEMIAVKVGYLPHLPFQARIVFDPNHGDYIGERFYSTRVLVDMSASESEINDMEVPIPVNAVGLPSSQLGRSQANASVEIPYEIDESAGQVVLLRNLSGGTLQPAKKAPVVTEPVPALVSAFRSGNDFDLNNGFLLDIDEPQILGQWDGFIENSRDVPSALGVEFEVDFRFETSCRALPKKGEIITSGSNFLEVVTSDRPIDSNGVITGLRVRSLRQMPIIAADLFGAAAYRPLYDSALDVDLGCWVKFSPRPRNFPRDGVSPFSTIEVQFTEPMDPTSVTAADTIKVIRGGNSTSETGESLVVGEVELSDSLTSAVYTPALPFAHEGNEDTYTFTVLADPDGRPEKGVTDLPGNLLAKRLPGFEFTIDDSGPIIRNSGVTQRFYRGDELPAPMRLDFRGNVFLDPSRGYLVPRPITHAHWVADRNNPVPSLMIPFPRGIQTPITPLGSRLQTLWRYADLGWQIRDESKYDLDVTGLYWSSSSGAVTSDFYPEFEIRLSHSVAIPDERKTNFGIARFPNSGLGGRSVPYRDNILGPQVVVHPRHLGYHLNPVDISVTEGGTFLMPWPMNRVGGEMRTFTWRDTSIPDVGGAGGLGVPLTTEVEPPLEVDNGVGSYASAGEVPTVGLPLLMEFRCYPTNSGVGVNPLNIALAINTSAQPNFRAFSTGGIDSNGRLVRKNPDLETFPSGGFNPLSSPPGSPTANQADNTFYIGALDVVSRISRGNSMWIDTRYFSPVYAEPIIRPLPNEQPEGTSLIVEFRGADMFDAAPEQSPYNANGTNAYGNLRWGTETFHNGDDDWKGSLSEVDGARYFQMRYTFIGNLEALLTPELRSLGIAYSPE